MNPADVAEMMAIFRTIYIPYPPHRAFQEQCLYLIELGRATRGQAQRGLRALAPSGAGKTTAAEALIRLFELKWPRSETFIPIVLVPLERATTPKKLMMAILDRFGDAYSASGNEQALKMRVKACFQRFGTLLLIIDEVQHLNFRLSGNNDVTDTLKRLLDDGVVPIVFLGTDEGREIFTSNVQLSGRLLAPADFQPLDLESHADRTLLGTYLALLQQQIVTRGILPRSGRLDDAWTRGCLHTVSGGLIGRVSRVVEAALEIALRRGAEQIEVDDLEMAVDRWAIPNGFTDTNPFKQRLPQ